MKRLLDLFRRKPAPTVAVGPTSTTAQLGAEMTQAEAMEAARKAGEAMAEQIRAKLIEIGAVPPGSKIEVSHTPVMVTEGAVYKQTLADGLKAIDGAIKPPDDPPTEGWTWKDWSEEMGKLAFPGWAPGRFAHRLSAPGRAATARFVFGIARGPFGIWLNNFDVCRHVEEFGDWQRERETLACLTHLPSGIGMGIYNGVDAAALAADTAVRTCPDLNGALEWDADPFSPWQRMYARIGEAWTAIGLKPTENAHAHDVTTGSGPWFVMGLNSLEAGKPEKLS